MKKSLLCLMFCMTLVLPAAGYSATEAGGADAAAQKQLQLPPATVAGVYVYRNSGLMGKTLVESVWLDGQPLGELRNGVYFYLEVAPGAHTLSAQAAPGENDLHFEVKAGKNYFFSQVFTRKVPVLGALPVVGSVVGAFSSNAKFVAVSDQDGQANVADCKQVELKNVAVTGTAQPECVTALETDPELKAISKKVALSGKEDNLFSMMSIEARPSKSERKVITQWGTKRELCFNANPPPRDAYYQLSTDTFNRGQKLILELSKGEMTYGQFAERRQEIKQTSLAQAQSLNQAK